MNPSMSVSPTGARRRVGHAVLAVSAMFVLAACDDGTGVDGPQNVSVAFQVGADAPLAGPAAAPGPAGAPARVISFDGSNGTLVLNEVLLIVSEAELEHVDGSCSGEGLEDSASNDDDYCPDFEVGPRLIELPLDGSQIEAFDGLIAPGIYKELEFEIEDLEDDEESAAERAAIEALRAEILTMVPDWPRKASVYVTGTFQPVDGEPEAFRVFVEAEIEIEMDLVPDLVVGDDGVATRDLLVDVRPDLWFRDGLGGVMDLRAWDYDATGELLALELEMEEGFVEVEYDH